MEDDFLIAQSAVLILEAHGATVIGPAHDLASGLRLASTEDLDLALLDVHLGKERSLAIGDKLKERGIPFAFATGYSRDNFEGHPDVEIINKPYTPERVAGALVRALARKDRPAHG